LSRWFHVEKPRGGKTQGKTESTGTKVKSNGSKTVGSIGDLGKEWPKGNAAGRQDTGRLEGKKKTKGREGGSREAKTRELEKFFSNLGWKAKVKNLGEKQNIQKGVEGKRRKNHAFPI